MFVMIVFGVVMIAIQASANFGSPPPSEKAVAFTGLFGYVILAFRLEKQRIPIDRQPST